MKRWISMLLVLLVALSFVGCAGSETTSTPNTDSSLSGPQNTDGASESGAADAGAPQQATADLSHYEGYIEIMGDRYSLGDTVGKFAENGWQDEKVGSSSIKFFADLDGIFPADTYGNPIVTFTRDGYTISVTAYGDMLREDTPVGELIIQYIEIESDRVTKENDVPWVLDSGFSNTDTMARMMELYPDGKLSDEENAQWVDENYAENIYTVGGGYIDIGTPWANMALQHKNEGKKFSLYMNTYAYTHTAQGLEMYNPD